MALYGGKMMRVAEGEAEFGFPNSVAQMFDYGQVWKPFAKEIIFILILRFTCDIKVHPSLALQRKGSFHFFLISLSKDMHLILFYTPKEWLGFCLIQKLNV